MRKILDKKEFYFKTTDKNSFKRKCHNVYIKRFKKSVFGWQVILNIVEAYYSRLFFSIVQSKFKFSNIKISHYLYRAHLKCRSGST